MPDLGKYADTVFAAYAASITLLLIVVVMSAVRSNRVKKALADAEARRDAAKL